MHELDRLVDEANRQLSVCNACRYCEGYCAVFPALERQSLIDAGELGYLANLCHDCRACYQACMYTPPHEFALNIPRLLAQARADSYRRYVRPLTLASAFSRPGGVALTGLLLGSVGIVLLWLGWGGSLTSRTDARFYTVLPYAALMFPSLALGALAVAGVVASFLTAASDMRVDRPGWLGATSIASEIALLTWMRGGGRGCDYPEKDRPSGKRRIYHQFVVAGFGLAFLATVAAAVEQDILGIDPPYPYLSAPVLLGILGGGTLCVGACGLLVLKGRDRTGWAPSQMRTGDYTLLVMLLLVSVTGFGLLTLRGTRLMGISLLIHLGAVFGLFLTMPYSKFLHAAPRVAALVRFAQDRRD